MLTDARGCVTVENKVRTLVGAACAYEVFALTTHKVPTLSKMCRYSRSFEFLLFGTLAFHFHLERKIVERLDKKGLYART